MFASEMACYRHGVHIARIEYYRTATNRVAQHLRAHSACHRITAQLSVKSVSFVIHLLLTMPLEYCTKFKPADSPT